MAADPSRPFIYVMKDLRKVVPPKREILKGIWLSFYYGAKIGVLGANGAGKSSLLRIMAGVDQEFLGEAWLGKGHTVGYLEQEPKLDPRKTVLENVQEGVGVIYVKHETAYEIVKYFVPGFDCLKLTGASNGR